MSAETAVKKQSRSKKVAVKEDAVDVNVEAPSENRAKKTRSRKQAAQLVEEADPDSRILEAPKTTKSRETKKAAALRTATKSSTSKRAAKSSGNGLQLESSSDAIHSSIILKSATAFADELQQGQSTSNVNGPDVESTLMEEQPSELQRKSTNDHQSAAKPVPLTSTSSQVTSDLNVKRSSFLASFFNDPEPAPVPPPQQRQETQVSAEEARTALKETTKHDFEDSILTSRGKFKAASPAPAAGMMDTAVPSLSSAQLRAFTTTSFASLKASSKPSTSASKAAPTTTATSKPKPSTASTPSRDKAKAQSTPPPTRTPPKPSPSSSSSSSKPLPTQPPTRHPHSHPSTPPRPTTLPYAEIKRDPHYRSLRRRWTAIIVSAPFVVWSTYELYQRWEKGEFREGLGGILRGIGDGNAGLNNVEGWEKGGIQAQAERVGIAEPGEGVVVQGSDTGKGKEEKS